MKTPRQRRKNPPSFDEAISDFNIARGLATRALKKRAVSICVLLACLTALFIPTARDQWPAIPAFLSSYHTLLITAYFISAYIIYGFYQAKHTVALLYLSGGCAYTAAMQILQLLSFPNLILAQGAILGGAQASIWLWCFWHAGLSLSILLYALSEWLWPGYVAAYQKRVNNVFLIMLFILVAASTASITVFHDQIPVLQINDDFTRLTTTGIGPAIQAISMIALLVLWRATRFRTALHVWLGVALMTLLFDNTITMIGGRFLSAGWYLGRINALISACAILLVYLYEINRAYLRTINTATKLETSNALLTMKINQARRDHLTGLPGRELFLEQVDTCHASSKGKGIVVAVLFIDLDGFKCVNDTYGHEHGDQILIKTADILRTVLRETDIAARMGGDEFVVCLFAPFTDIQSTMIDIAGRIVKMVSGIGSGIGCSIGVSLNSADSLNMASALHNADQAMYQAKTLGKNSFVIYGQPLLRKLHGFKNSVAKMF